MPVIPEAVIEDVRARTDIVQVIGDRIPLKRAGAAWKACCPFHNEKTPSFTVNPQRQSFKCFGCGEGGDVFKFLMKHDGMSFVDAVRYLAEKCGVEIVTEEDDGHTARAKRLYQINAEFAAFCHRCLLKAPGAAGARAYLEKRQLDAATVEAFGLGYDPDEWGALDEFARRNRFTPEEMVAAGIGTLPDRPGASANLRDRFHGRLMFPICDQTGRVVAFSARVLDASKSPAKYVNSPETDVFKKARVLYALDKAQRHIASSKHREAIVCEGQIDVIRCHACGFPRAVASEGTAFTPEHAKLLHRYADSVVELFDADAAGRKAAVRTAAILLAEGLAVRVAEMPAGEDPDSFLLKNPPEAFQKLLDDAVGIVPFHVAFLRAQERDPDGADAAARIVQGVLGTVAACKNAVQKARMVQEVAQLMHLPEDAIRDELAGVEEALRRQEQSAARREAARADSERSAPRPVAPAVPA
ncbi:MAG: DNA primase, partial [Kiritimatiellae bacterium]|nr:DNA primase [Kiritimatiellia bacterium]